MRSVLLWRRRGRILVPPLESAGVWRTHCQGPFLLPLSETRWRLYFTGRDDRNRSHAFRAELELELGGGVRLVECDPVPVLCPGGLGAFDAEGAMPGSVVVRGPEVWMYYTGWAVRRDVPFQTGIGLAISKDGGLSFAKVRGPILGQGIHDEFSVTSPLVTEADQALRMLYASTVSWTEWNGHLEPRYALKSACSRDGLQWQTSADFTVDFSDPEEGGISRPSLIHHGGRYHMWYSRRDWRDYRTNPAAAYRLGYATSDDGDRWQRDDGRVAFSNPPEPDEWDSVMQAYPAVIRVGDDLLCYYSGNGFGQGGIGYATLEGGVGALEAVSASTPTT